VYGPWTYHYCWLHSKVKYFNVQEHLVWVLHKLARIFASVFPQCVIQLLIK
jgi:hypothetical protein